MTNIFNCSICLQDHNENTNYFQCSENNNKHGNQIIHNICRLCFPKLMVESYDLAECPTCKAPARTEAVDPNLIISFGDMTSLDMSKVPIYNIFIHQNFNYHELSKYKIQYLNTKNQKIGLYFYNGMPKQLGGNFICVDGFLYSYDEKKDEYCVAINKGKFQFWDTTRLQIKF